MLVRANATGRPILGLQCERDGEEARGLQVLEKISLLATTSDRPAHDLTGRGSWQTLPELGHRFSFWRLSSRSLIRRRNSTRVRDLPSNLPLLRCCGGAYSFFFRDGVRSWLFDRVVFGVLGRVFDGYPL